MQAKSANHRSFFWLHVLAFPIAVWTAVLLYLSRYYMLDDSLIHLRYAENLLRFHVISYNGGKADYGTSSLLYVVLLAALRSVFNTVFLAKIFSVVLYACLLLLVIRVAVRRSALWIEALYLTLLLSLVGPMGVRWLADGMETGFSVLLATLLALATVSQSHRPNRSAWWQAGCFALGACIVLLRIEMAMLCVLACCSIYFSSPQGSSTKNQQSRLGHRHESSWRSSHFAMGAFVSLIAIRLVMGHFLPDTALAKHGTADIGIIRKLENTAANIGTTLLSSATLGVGLFFTWVLSALGSCGTLRAKAKRLLPWACANAPFPSIFVLSALRQQAIPAVRYLVWSLGFSIIWNLRESSWQEKSAASEPSAEKTAIDPAKFIRPTQVLSLLLLAAILLSWPIEMKHALRVYRGYGCTFLAMRGSQLGYFQNQIGIAGDIGYIGYFTQANICDLAGLVNGRQAAALTYAQRTEACALKSPAFLFVSKPQADSLKRWMSLSSWKVCSMYNFANFIHDDMHYLLVLPRNASTACAAAGTSIGTPLRTVEEVLSR